MRIYSMTATFGKLEHETLALEPGLNIIQAPNEWGKSTWCAFLVAMLYGIDTRLHSTKTALADKERYTPWSGSPMSGRIDLNWNGRDITIERRTKGRSILGDFRAYETSTGLAMPELTAANCGQTLLGVERSVFTRAGFLRLNDLPVTQDESLRRRLNALVTTGDESGAGDMLAQKLKELKNRCRYNRTGLLPQAEARREELEKKLRELESLQTQCEKIKTRQVELETHMARLANHTAALQYAAAQADAGRVAEAEAARDSAARQLAEWEATCKNLPSREQAEQKIQELQAVHEAWLSLQMEEQMLPALPQPPEVPVPFQELTPEAAVSQAETDREQWKTLTQRKKPNPILWILGILGLLAGAGLLIGRLPVPAYAAFGIGSVLLIAGVVRQILTNRSNARLQAKADVLSQRYGTSDPDAWTAMAREYQQAQETYDRELAHSQAARGDLDSRQEQLIQRMMQVTGGEPLQACGSKWNQVLSAWDACGNARRELQRTASHVQTLSAMAKTAQPPKFPDDMTCTEAETVQLQTNAAREQRELQLRLGQYQGRMEQLGRKELLEGQLAQVRQRIDRLEETYAALTLAQNTLAEATAELQRRFAPRISARAQELFGQLTGNRYDRLTLGEDLSLHAGAAGEDTLRPSLWRSDGTVDQLYLALRLAVAEELTPDAPLVLDDALVRFDDTRLTAAMEILRQEAENKQVILFTCQGREQRFLPQ